MSEVIEAELTGQAQLGVTFGTSGNQGLNGWSPAIAIVADGERRVMQIVDWVGGTGSKPALGYVGPTGLVGSAAAATDIRGAAGAGGGASPAGPDTAVQTRSGSALAGSSALTHDGQTLRATSNGAPAVRIRRKDVGTIPAFDAGGWTIAELESMDDGNDRGSMEVTRTRYAEGNHDLWNFRLRSTVSGLTARPYLSFGWYYGTPAVVLTMGIVFETSGVTLSQSLANALRLEIQGGRALIHTDPASGFYVDWRSDRFCLLTGYGSTPILEARSDGTLRFAGAVGRTESIEVLTPTGTRTLVFAKGGLT